MIAVGGRAPIERSAGVMDHGEEEGREEEARRCEEGDEEGHQEGREEGSEEGRKKAVLKAKGPREDFISVKNSQSGKANKPKK